MSGGLPFGYRGADSEALRGEARGTMMCGSAQESLSEFWEGSLSAAASARVEAHLASCPACAREARQMKAMLDLFKDRCVRREPVLDLWAELAPKVEQAVAEERLGVMDRLRLRGSRFCNNVAAGA
ncbi:MAG: zf-HC2 domain-containing protein, partial [Cytophagales bacterium]|nr:zf-HC2 domain-containing protein [Armatimonadota bacterium]